MMRFIHAQRGMDAEEKAFREAYELFRSQDLRFMMMAARIVQAIDSLGPGTPLDCIAEALTMAKTEGYIRVFVDFGMELAPLLRQAISRGIEAEYARKLLDVIEAEDLRRRASRGRRAPGRLSAGLLSERELEVMRLLAEGLSNQEIADRLKVSLATARTHVYRAFDKLNAKDRLQAVMRAKELNLL
jgi:LuxR family maltose regulon positive regulatory protein